MIQEKIQKIIEDTFEIHFMELLNESHMHSGPATESHFKLILVSSSFEALSKVKRQQAVYKSLAELMPLFHALALHTYTPDEWLKRQQAAPSSPKCASVKA